MTVSGRLTVRLGLLLIGGGTVVSVPVHAQVQNAGQGGGLPPPPAASSAAAGASAGSLVSLLIQRAQYWYDQGRYGNAQDALSQVKQIAPNDPRVMALTGQWALRQGDIGGAQRVAASLRILAPDAPETIRLDQALHLQDTSQGELPAIRALAQAGRTAAAAAGYRRLFPNGPPPQYAVEYYQTLAGAVGYRDRGREGLRALVAANPNDMAAQLAYAQALTWLPATRQDGLARLTKLASISSLSADDLAAVRRDWREALHWLPEVPESTPYFDAWLKVNPSDNEISRLRQRASAAESEHAVLERTQAYQDLSASEITDADKHFSNALAQAPNDADALGGLGLVRMRQGQMAQARDLLEKAMQADPSSAARWQSALNATKVSGSYEQVRRLMEQGQYDAAGRAVDAALQVDPSQTMLVALRGEIARRRGRTAEAEASYRQAIRTEPDNVVALEGLYQILRESGRTQEADMLIARIRRLSPAFEQQMAGNELIAQAERATTLDDRISLLRQGLEDRGNDPWLRLRLAQALLQADQRTEAREVMAPLLSPGRAASVAELQAGIYFANQANDFSAVRQLLQRLPRGSRTPDIRRIADRVEELQLVQDAPPNAEEARLYFMQIARRGNDPDGERGRMIATALLDRDDPKGASAVLQTFMNAGSLTFRQRIAYAGLFMRMQEPERARHLLERIEGSSLTSDDSVALRNIQAGLAIMTADRLNAEGRRADAYDALAPALTTDQPDPAARLALARLYQSANQTRKALSIARAVITRYPNDLDARLAVVRLALQNDGFALAEEQLRFMTEEAPADPRTWLASATLHRAGGNWTASLSDLARARDLRMQQIGNQERAGGGHDGGVLIDGESARINPFRNTAQATTDGGVGTQDPILRNIDSDIASTTQEFAPFVDAGPIFRGRSGTGLNQLTEGDLPITGSFALGTGRMSLNVTPTVLASGVGSMDYVEGLREIGTAALTKEYGAVANRFHAVGVGTNLAYAWKWLKVDVGSSPLGFRETNVLAGAEVSPQITNQLRIRVAADRRAVTDSVLAYAGLHDGLKGSNWGGVVRNRLNGQLEYGDPLLNFYVRGGFAYIQGHNVQDNEEYESGAGGSVSVFKDTTNEVRLGVDLTWFKYNNNQYLFSLGNGGYFSPQSYFALLVPVRYSGHSGNWLWNVNGSIGYQSYSSRSSLFYPTRPELQEQLDIADPTAAVAGGVSDSGLVGGASGHLSYQVTSALRVSGDFQYQKAGPWNETTAGLSLHYSLLGTP